jgi:uncharacterized membrane protein HdeD (DUF308 family)
LSNSTANPASFGAGDSPFSGITMKWGWFAALGILSIVAGFLALLDVVAFTIISVIFIGAMLLVSGIFQVVHAFATKTWRHFGINVVLGVLYVVGGLLIMREPVRGSLVITIFLLAALVVGGIMRIVIALRHRELRYWWLMAINSQYRMDTHYSERREGRPSGCPSSRGVAGGLLQASAAVARCHSSSRGCVTGRPSRARNCLRSQHKIRGSSSFPCRISGAGCARARQSSCVRP